MTSIPYIPTPTEIYSRGEALRWMRDMGWDQGIIDSILYHDNPSVNHVRLLVYRHGPIKAYKILQELLS